MLPHRILRVQIFPQRKLSKFLIVLHLEDQRGKECHTFTYRVGHKYQKWCLTCWKYWSGREDLNLRPPGPEPDSTEFLHLLNLTDFKRFKIQRLGAAWWNASVPYCSGMLCRLQNRLQLKYLPPRSILKTFLIFSSKDRGKEKFKAIDFIGVNLCMPRISLSEAES